MKTIVLIAVMVLADSAGDVLLSKGMREAGLIQTFHLKALLAVGRNVIGSKSFLSSFFFTALSFLSFLILLSWADLSFVFPARSLVYVTSTLGARWILNETVSLERWGGILLVCLGVALVSFP